MAGFEMVSGSVRCSAGLPHFLGLAGASRALDTFLGTGVVGMEVFREATRELRLTPCLEGEGNTESDSKWSAKSDWPRGGELGALSSTPAIGLARPDRRADLRTVVIGGG